MPPLEHLAYYIIEREKEETKGEEEEEGEDEDGDEEAKRKREKASERLSIIHHNNQNMTHQSPSSPFLPAPTNNQAEKQPTATAATTHQQINQQQQRIKLKGHAKVGCLYPSHHQSLFKSSLIISLSLPLLFMFLLPSSRFDLPKNILTSTNTDNCRVCHSHLLIKQEKLTCEERRTESSNNCVHHESDKSLSSRLIDARLNRSSNVQFIRQQDKLFLLIDLLVSLLRFPLERLKFVSGLCLLESQHSSHLMLASATLLNDDPGSRNDLQEEETHMLLMSPAEQRTSYLAPTQQAPAYQQVSRGGHHGQPHNLLYQQHQAASQQQPAQDQYQPVGAGEHGAGADYGSGPSEGGVVGTGVEVDQAQANSLAGIGTSGLASDSSQMQTRGDLPAIRALNVKCEKNHMTVNIVFDRPFYGLVFSKGHYNDQKCVHMPPNSGQSSVNFDIHLGKCGMTSSDASQQQQVGSTGAALTAASQQQQQPNGLYIENIIIIQYDPQVQEIYDQARKLRCTWYDYYEKSVTFRPYNVDMLDAVTANFLGDNIQCWMQIQVGKGPWSSEVAGIVKIGQTMTMVLAIKDDENRFDMLVRNCQASDGKHQPIQLVDEYGCVARPKIMARFQKVRNFGPAATVVSYAHFQAFKFPDSMSVHFNCVIQVCRTECPEPVCSGQAPGVGVIGGDSQPGIGSSVGASAGDYAASGTEIVASKEALPSSVQQIPSLTQQQQPPNSAINLKLDESQGRVQVKLDTSMMAGLNQHQSARAQSGPLPPHLLHAGVTATGNNFVSSPNGGRSLTSAAGGPHSQQQQHTYLSSSYYKPTNGPTGGSTALNGNRQIGQPSMMNGRASTLAVATGVAPPSGHPSIHYSSPYPIAHQPISGIGSNPRATYQQQSALDRMGEQMPPLGAGQTFAINQLNDKDTPNPVVGEDVTREPATIIDHKLSEFASAILDGSPRALKFEPFQFNNTRRAAPASNHRYRRSASRETKQQTPPFTLTGGQQDSTSIRTQKTIQVVSPQDIAFNLLDDDDDDVNDSRKLDGSATSSFGSSSRAKTNMAARYGTISYSQISDDSSTVCFSSARLMCAILFTLGVLASSVLMVTFVLLRQRARQALERSEKATAASICSSVQHDYFDNSTSSSQMSLPTALLANTTTTTTTNNNNNHRQQKLIEQQYANNYRNRAHATRTLGAEANLAQRNNYLARLYSQFIPAAHWPST